MKINLSQDAELGVALEVEYDSISELDLRAMALFVVKLGEIARNPYPPLDMKAYSASNVKEFTILPDKDVVASVNLSPEAVAEMNGDDYPPLCVKCGLDNRNNTHDGLQRGGHLDHDFTPVEPDEDEEPQHTTWCSGGHDLLLSDCNKYREMSRFAGAELPPLGPPGHAAYCRGGHDVQNITCAKNREEYQAGLKRMHDDMCGGTDD